MAPKPAPLHVQAANFVLDVANGRHALSKLIPIVLWLMDGGLTSIIIWKVPCTEDPVAFYAAARSRGAEAIG